MHKPLRKLLATILTLAMLVSLLPIGAAPAQAAGEGESTGAFNVTKNTGSSDNAYTYTNGVLTVGDGADITISMDSSETTPTSDRIVVAENATATITLAGVNIKGSDCDGSQVIAAKSAIDLSNGSILTIDLSANTENTLAGGNGITEGSGAPGIHVPDSASLIIQGEGSLSVSGGTSSTAFCGVGIGGNASTTSAGEACGTVIIFASDNVTITAGKAGSGSDSADDIGGGNGQNQNNGDDGQGIRPGTDGNYTVYGNLTRPCDITIPQDATVTIPQSASLTVPENVTLTNNGTITGAGSVTVSGDVSGSGSMSVTGTVMKKEQAAPNALSSTTDVTDTSVTLSAVTDTGGIGGIEYGYTTGDETSVPEERWQDDLVFDGLQPVTSYTFYARYAGNDYYEPSPASSGLTVTTKKSDAQLGNLTVTGQTGFEGHFQYGDNITVTFTPQRNANTSSNALSLEEDTATLSYTPTGGEIVTLATATAEADGSFELTYDTKEKKLPIGEDLSLTVSYGGSDALNPVKETVTLTLDKAILKNMPTATGSFVYGETLTVNYTNQDDETVTYQWYRGDQPIDGATSDTYTLTEADIGQEITVTATATDAYHTDSVTSTPVTVGKAPQTALTISGLPDKVYVGDQFTLTASGGSGNGALSWEVLSGPAEIDASTGAVRITGEGTIVIRVTKAGDTAYSATSAEITFTANEIPYTGRFSYEISTSVGDNGTISVDRYATEGERVTITVSPDDAYKLDDLSVTAHGKEVTLTDNGDGTFSFTMPSADVKISATFAEDPDWTEPEEPAIDVSDLFIDVAPNAWCKDAVQYAYAGGLMTGVSADAFAPEQTTTRAMIVSILARLEGVTSAQAAGFADVSDEWYATAVNWAASAGVVSGTGDGNFSPNAAITREQLAAMLMNYSAWKGEDVSARADLSAYSDQPSTWAEETMSWAVAEGLISGVTNTELQPQGNATRAQVAAILQRFLAQ